MKTAKHSFTLAVVFFVAVTLWGCSSHVFTAEPVTDASKYPSVLERAQKKHWYMYMQSGLNHYTIASVDMDNGKQQMTVTLNKVDSSKLIISNNSQNTASQKATRQIHVFMNDSTTYTLDEPHTIPMTHVGRIEVFN